MTRSRRIQRGFRRGFVSFKRAWNIEKDERRNCSPLVSTLNPSSHPSWPFLYFPNRRRFPRRNAPGSTDFSPACSRLTTPAKSASPPKRAAPLSSPAPVEEDEEFLWHDPALAMDERMKLAQSKPLPARFDGGDGAVGLRFVRLFVPDLRRGDRVGRRRRHLQMHARRTRDQIQAQRTDRAQASRCPRAARPRRRSAQSGRQRAALFARPSVSRADFGNSPAQPQGLAKGRALRLVRFAWFGLEV